MPWMQKKREERGQKRTPVLKGEKWEGEEEDGGLQWTGEMEEKESYKSFIFLWKISYHFTYFFHATLNRPVNE